MEVSEVRRRVRAAIEAARRGAQERRTRADEAVREYEVFLRERAVPVFQMTGSALVAEGHRFTVSTPAESVRLASESSPDDYLEIVLDTSVDPPVALGRLNRGRGRRLLTSERPVKSSAPVRDITEEDVLLFITEELPPLVER